jgi:molecular chaperone DnaK (HSP70)
VDLLAKKLGRPVIVPPNPQIITAIGAALTASKQDGVKPTSGSGFRVATIRTAVEQLGTGVLRNILIKSFRG